ncbi:MAG: short-chain dehydrogenase, partial [Bacteroidota bacterium]
LDGLRNRLYAHGVHVVTVKPGFVRTKMTEGLDLPKRLTAEPEQVGKAVFRAWKKKKNTLYTKGIWRLVMWVIRNIPEWQFKKMKI